MNLYLNCFFQEKKGRHYGKALFFSLSLLLFFFFISPPLFAHADAASVNLPEKTVYGEVVDSLSGNALPGVTVKVKGENSGTTTDEDGKFQLSVSDNAILEISYLGYNKKEVPVNGQSEIKITLSSTATSLNQVVVVGYGTSKKKDLTGAVSKIGSEKIEKRPMKDAVQAMQGQIAGVDVASNQRPGEVGDINIRGVRSLTASNKPLFVVDGIPLISGGIDYLNPKDIESISVLKDASATAIYGSRGANGVVLVTTKGGKKGNLKVSYSGSATIQKLVDKETPMTASQYITWRRWAYYYSNPSLYPRGDEPNKTTDYKIFKGSSDPSAWKNILRGWSSGTWDGSKVQTTCWTCMVTQTGVSTQHTLSVSGGTDKLKGYASFGYLNNKGTSKGQSYTRYTGNTKLTFSPTKWFTMGANMSVSYSKQEYGQSNTGRSSISSSSSIYNAAKGVYPYAVPYDSAGNRVIYPGGDQAVKTVVDEWKFSTDERTSLRAFGSFHAQFDIGEIFPVLKGLKYRMNFGPDFSMNRDGVYIDGKSVIRNGTSYASLSKDQKISYTLDNLIYYNRIFGKNDFRLTLLQTQTKYHTEGSSISADDIPFASQKWNALTTGNVPNLRSWNSNLTEQQLMSYMGRINYSYNDKYLLTVSGRWDGASQLAAGNKWSFFPSAALGWRMDQEEFLQSTSWINQLKIRLGVGVTGNSAIEPYATKGGVSALFYPFGTSITGGSIPSSALANQNLGWEKTTQYNLGFDFSFFNSRVSGTLDFYTSDTKDLLMKQSIPTVTGYSSTYANVGQTANKGVDVTLNTYNIQTDNFQWNTNLNVSYHKDHIVALANGNEDDISNGWFIDEPIGVIYGYETDGLWQQSDKKLMDKFNDNGSDFELGMVKPIDQNGDFEIDPNHDRVIIGNTLPRWVIGMVNNFSFHQFEFSFFLYGRLGYKYDTGGEAQTGRFNQRLIDYYNENNTDAYYQKPIYTVGTGDIYSKYLGYMNGSFLEIRNISLAYNLPREILSRWGMSRFKIYVQAADLGMLYSGIDFMNMDVRSPYWNRGFTAGIDVTF